MLSFISTKCQFWNFHGKSYLHKTSIIVLTLLFSAVAGVFAQQPALVYLENGKLSYTPFAVEGQSNKAHIIPDFSHAGFKGGGVAIPDEVETIITISPEPGDDTDRIQQAIDELAARPINGQGFRGALMLKKGHYSLSKPLVIHGSGIVLRGEGQGKNETVLHANMRTRHSVIEIKGADVLDVASETYQNITSPYVPLGTYSLEVEDASKFEIGDTIVVTRTPNLTWITDLGMDEATLCANDPNGCDGWTPESYAIDHERVIVGINGNEITLNIPMVDVIESKYGGGKVAKASARNRIRQCGIDNLRIESYHATSDDEDHAWTGVEISHAENCWVRKVTGEYLAYSIAAISNANFNTIEDCAFINPISRLAGGRRYAYVVNDGLGNLFQRNYSRNGRHDFATGSRVTGPNAFIDGLGEAGNADTGPHHRWATGLLFENIVAWQIRVRNRGSSGSGHGWAGAQTMFWNVTSYAEEITVESPPGAMNWGIGCIGPTQLGEGYWESWGTKVLPRSLYLQQLKDRLGNTALDNIATEAQKSGSISEQLVQWKGVGALAMGGAKGEIPEVDFKKPNSTIHMDTWEGASIEINATDADGSIQEVLLLLDGEPIGSLKQPPYLFNNLRPVFEILSDDQHTLTALATDNEGNVNTNNLKIYGFSKEAIDLKDYHPLELCRAIATSFNADATAEKVIDGDESPDSRWSAEENGATLVVESCKAQNVDAIGIKWYLGNVRQAIFDLEVSLDSASWRQVYSGNSSGTSLHQEPFSIRDSIKYMRYTGYGNTNSRWNAIVEIDFYQKSSGITDTLSTGPDSTSIALFTSGFSQGNEPVLIYPNPANEHVNVSCGESGKRVLYLSDLMGKPVLRLESVNGLFAFKTTALKSGMYIVNLIGNQKRKHHLLMIEH